MTLTSRTTFYERQPKLGQRFTRRELEQDLAALGLERGHDVLIHCSLGQIGRLKYGPETLMRAVRRVIGQGGTIVVPAQTPQNSNTSPVFLDAIAGMDAQAIQDYEAKIEGFSRYKSESFGMGVFAEHVRTRQKSIRSDHPQASFAAFGPSAAQYMATHDLTCHLGERSPIGALYRAGAMTLLAGVGYESCTAMHLAEYKRDNPPAERAHRCYVMHKGQRVTLDFNARDLNPGCFPAIGADFEAKGHVRSGKVGAAESRLFSIKAVVDHAVQWMNDRLQTVSI